MRQQACQLGVQVPAGERGQADGLHQSESTLIFTLPGYTSAAGKRERQVSRSKSRSVRLLSMTALYI